jgi:hypothetical protein
MCMSTPVTKGAATLDSAPYYRSECWENVRFLHLLQLPWSLLWHSMTRLFSALCNRLTECFNLARLLFIRIAGDKPQEQTITVFSVGGQTEYRATRTYELNVERLAS